MALYYGFIENVGLFTHKKIPSVLLLEKLKHNM